MANELFSNFPEIQYTLNTGKVITIKDFFRKSNIRRISKNTVQRTDFVFFEHTRHYYEEEFQKWFG